MKLTACCTFVFLFCGSIAFAFGTSSRPLLVVEDAPKDDSCQLFDGSDRVDVSDFSRLLLMQISKANVFRCIDRRTYRTQSKEISLGDSGDIELKSAARSISWVIRGRQGSRGATLTVSLGYNDITPKGNGELIKSEDVIVRERGLKGADLLLAAAKKAARAIVFSLKPSEVLDVEKSPSGKVKATIAYGNGFFAVGDSVYFVKNTEKKGRSIRKKTEIGTISSVDADTAVVMLSKGTVEEGYEIELNVVDSEADKADLCPDCDGRRKIKTQVKCGDCNGQGKLWHIKGSSRTLKPCKVCNGRCTKTVEEPCSTCNGTGRAR